MLAADGAWCWFSDPRALWHDDALYAGWINSQGDVVVGRWDPKQPETPAEEAVLAPEFEIDDHDHPALCLLPDGSLAAFYALHTAGDLHLRVLPNGSSLQEWSADRTLGFDRYGDGPRGVTYANPFLLSEEEDALYLFWRGTHYKPSFSVSRDAGASWSEPRTLLAARDSDDTVRPYVKYATDGRDTIHFLFTDGHPRDEPRNSVYYLRYTRGGFYRADGSLVGNMKDLPFDPEQCDLVYEGETAGRAWVWSLATSPDGHPVALATRHPSETEHHYLYATWSGERWNTRDLTFAGAWFPDTPEGAREPEPHYSGGAALDPRDPRFVYLSRPVDGVFEIERWFTPDGGQNWESSAITSGSTANNVRPFVAADASGKAAVVWMRAIGGYRHYTDFRTELRVALSPSPDSIASSD